MTRAPSAKLYTSNGTLFLIAAVQLCVMKGRKRPILLKNSWQRIWYRKNAPLSDVKAIFHAEIGKQSTLRTGSSYRSEFFNRITQERTLNAQPCSPAGKKATLAAAAPGAKDFTQAKGYRHRKLTDTERARNRTKSRVRAKVEHQFFVIKRQFGFAKVRYRGLEKNAQRLLLPVR